jgi:hypothetical protein
MLTGCQDDRTTKIEIPTPTPRWVVDCIDEAMGPDFEGFLGMKVQAEPDSLADAIASVGVLVMDLQGDTIAENFGPLEPSYTCTAYDWATWERTRGRAARDLENDLGWRPSDERIDQLTREYLEIQR